MFLDYFIKYGILLLGLIIVAYSAVMIFLMNFNVGIGASLGVGIILTLAGTFYYRVKDVVPFKIFMVLLAFLLIILICASFCVVSYGKKDTATQKEDAIIVLGCGIDGENVTSQLELRLDSAIEYYKENEAVILVSGGKGTQENVTEAYAMEKYLLSRGIPQKKILKEELSTSTQTNIVNSKEILDKFFGAKEYNVVIVTSDYHIYRAQCIADMVGLNATHVHSSLVWYEYPIRCVRETLAIIKSWF